MCFDTRNDVIILDLLYYSNFQTPDKFSPGVCQRLLAINCRLRQLSNRGAYNIWKKYYTFMSETKRVFSVT